MPIRKFDASITHTGEDCSVIYPNDAYVWRELKTAFPDGSKVTVEFKSRRKPRSLAANAYLHMCLQMIADETGNSLESVKSTVKALYAKKPLLDTDGEPIYDKVTGEQAMYIQDTRDMSSIEAFELTEKVRMFSMDFLGLVLPDPEENIKLKLK